MGKKNKNHADAGDGIEDAETTTADEAESTSAIAEDATPLRSAADLKGDYEALVVEVQRAVKASHDLERTLLAEVKEKVKAHADDVEALKARKREAYIAYEAARNAEASRTVPIGESEVAS